MTPYKTEQLPETDVKKKFRQTSRYRNTSIYKNDDGHYYFGIWKVPKIDEQPEDIYYTIRYGQSLNLATISYEKYGTKDLWWVIAVANNILDPFTELKVNDVIRIPNLSYIYSKILT